MDHFTGQVFLLPCKESFYLAIEQEQFIRAVWHNGFKRIQAQMVLKAFLRDNYARKVSG